VIEQCGLSRAQKPRQNRHWQARVVVIEHHGLVESNDMLYHLADLAGPRKDKPRARCIPVKPGRL
jgi:hypothetical protein